MYRLCLTELANDDLDQLVDYLAVKLANPTAATRLLDQVERCYRDLQLTPAMYEECHNPLLAHKHYRKAPVMNYVLVYQINEDEKTVTIYRFFYGRQDYESLL